MGVFGDEAAFVGLDVADDVPDDVGAVGKLGGFVVPFLDVVFAEVALPVLIQRADVIGGEGFADGDAGRWAWASAWAIWAWMAWRLGIRWDMAVFAAGWLGMG